MASQCETTEITRFPDLRDRVVDVVNHMLRKCVGPTQSMISNLINIELAYINTSHPDFIGTPPHRRHTQPWPHSLRPAKTDFNRVWNVVCSSRGESCGGAADGEDGPGECQSSRTGNTSPTHIRPHIHLAVPSPYSAHCTSSDCVSLDDRVRAPRPWGSGSVGV